MVNFPTRIPDCDSNSPALLDLFIFSDSSICSTMALPPMGNSDHVVVSVDDDRWLVTSDVTAYVNKNQYRVVQLPFKV